MALPFPKPDSFVSVGPIRQNRQMPQASLITQFFLGMDLP